MAAGTSIFTLMGSILVDNTKANESISKTESRAEGLAKKFGSGMKTAAKWGAAITGAAVATGGAMLGMANKSAKAMDEIDKGSKRMGVSTKAYQEMEYWASQNGLAQADMEKAVGRLNQRIGMAKDGNEKYAKALEATGVNMEDVINGTISTEDAFTKSIQTLSEMTNGQEQAALASELFGTKLGRELLPALQDGSLSFEDAKKKAEELGIVLSEDSVEAGVKFTDTWDSLKRAGGALFSQLGVELIPIFQKLAEWIMEHMPQIREVAGNAIDAISDAAMWGWEVFEEYLLPVFRSIFEWVQENWPIISSIIKTAFKVIETVWKNILAPVLGFLWEALKKVTDFVSNNFPGFEATVESVMEGVSTVVSEVADVFGWLYDKIDDALDKWNEWRNRPEDSSKGGYSAGGSSGGGGGGWGGSSRSRDPGIDGRHADGLARVPFDGYIGMLHENEEVLKANDPRNQNNPRGLGREIADALIDAGITKPVVLQIDGKKVGESIIRVVDKKLNDKYTDDKLAKGMV